MQTGAYATYVHARVRLCRDGQTSPLCSPQLAGGCTRCSESAKAVVCSWPAVKGDVRPSNQRLRVPERR